MVGYFTLRICHVIVDASILTPIYKLATEEYGHNWDFKLVVKCGEKSHFLQTEHKTFSTMLKYYTLDLKKGGDSPQRRNERSSISNKDSSPRVAANKPTPNDFFSFNIGGNATDHASI